jgi:hypothetical protein
VDRIRREAVRMARRRGKIDRLAGAKVGMKLEGLRDEEGGGFCKAIYINGLWFMGGIIGRVGIAFAYRNKVAGNLHDGKIKN